LAAYRRTTPHHADPNHHEQTAASVKEGSQDHQDFLSNFNKYRRTSVSAERLDPATETLDENSNPGLYLSNEKRRLLDSSVAKNFIFNNMDEDSIESVLGALQEKAVPNGTEIITQGDVGDYFYIIESGSVDFYKDGTKVNSAASGSSFGELALLHNAPRAATVIATSDCKLWALDRVSFRKIVLANTASKRNMYGEFLREVSILKPLSDAELLRLSDALGSCTYQAGEVIVREGEAGQDFFMIEYGTAEVSQRGTG
jgi:cAMP-dependent protein kinase regulator